MRDGTLCTDAVRIFVCSLPSSPSSKAREMCNGEAFFCFALVLWRLMTFFFFFCIVLVVVVVAVVVSSGDGVACLCTNLEKKVCEGAVYF